MQPEKLNSLRLYNSLTRRVEIFKPRRPAGEVKMFTCGPSIYNTPHIGNFRTFLYEDILHRYLEYLGYRVKRLINFTDVEDKAIQQARKESVSLAELTGQAADDFYRGAGLLHIRLPDFIPRSTTSVDQSVKLIRELMRKGLAYRYKESIFYDPLKFKGFGKLYGLDPASWPEKKRRYWKDTYPGNRWNLGDFILWHGYSKERDGPVFWETPLGRGRPAWNIQDPAMISKHLGYEVDISCGGVDNLYRHHDYTIAIMEGVSGKKFSNFWLHGEHVLSDGRKMSKSKGNILYLSTLTEENFKGAELRFYLVSQHYRKKLNLTRKSLKTSVSRCDHLRMLAADLFQPFAYSQSPIQKADKYIERLSADFTRHMSDDLQVGRACTAVERNLTQLVDLKNKTRLTEKQWQKIKTGLLAIDSVLQVLFP